MSRADRISGKDVATTWIARIAMNMLSPMAQNPAQVRTDTRSPGMLSAVMALRGLRPGEFPEFPRLDADPDRQHRGVQEGEQERGPREPEVGGQNCDFGRYDEIVGMVHESVGA